MAFGCPRTAVIDSNHNNNVDKTLWLFFHLYGRLFIHVHSCKLCPDNYEQNEKNKIQFGLAEEFTWTEEIYIHR